MGVLEGGCSTAGSRATYVTKTTVRIGLVLSIIGGIRLLRGYDSAVISPPGGSLKHDDVARSSVRSAPVGPNALLWALWPKFLRMTCRSGSKEGKLDPSSTQLLNWSVRRHFTNRQ